MQKKSKPTPLPKKPPGHYSYLFSWRNSKSHFMAFSLKHQVTAQNLRVRRFPFFLLPQCINLNGKKSPHGTRRHAADLARLQRKKEGKWGQSCRKQQTWWNLRRPEGTLPLHKLRGTIPVSPPACRSQWPPSLQLQNICWALQNLVGDPWPKNSA